MHFVHSFVQFMPFFQELCCAFGTLNAKEPELYLKEDHRRAHSKLWLCKFYLLKPCFLRRVNHFDVSNCYLPSTSSNYEDSFEQRGEDERLGEWLFAAKLTHFTAVGAASVPLVRCGRCVPNTWPQGFSFGPICHHAVPYSDYGSVRLPLYLLSSTTVLACLPLKFQSYACQPYSWKICSKGQL